MIITATTQSSLVEYATALGADVDPDAIHAGQDDHTAHAQLVPDEAVFAAARTILGDPSQDVPRDLFKFVARALEAAYPATRADQLRKFANELEAALETGDSPHQLPYDWRDDADLLDGDR